MTRCRCWMNFCRLLSRCFLGCRNRLQLFATFNTARSTKPRRCGTKRAKQLRRMHNLLQSLMLASIQQCACVFLASSYCAAPVFHLWETFEEASQVSADSRLLCEAVKATPWKASGPKALRHPGTASEDAAGSGRCSAGLLSRVRRFRHQSCGCPAYDIRRSSTETPLNAECQLTLLVTLDVACPRSAAFRSQSCLSSTQAVHDRNLGTITRRGFMPMHDYCCTVKSYTRQAGFCSSTAQL